MARNISLTSVRFISQKILVLENNWNYFYVRWLTLNTSWPLCVNVNVYLDRSMSRRVKSRIPLNYTIFFKVKLHKTLFIPILSQRFGVRALNEWHIKYNIYIIHASVITISYSYTIFSQFTTIKYLKIYILWNHYNTNSARAQRRVLKE